MRYFILLLHTLSFSILIAQEAEMVVEGGIKIGNVEADPEPGTIRWTGSDFEGWNGLIWVSLTGNMSVGTVEDVDGNVYKTVRIGDQTWMAENLRTTRYNDSTTIDQITNDAIWSSASAGAWCWYDNNSSYEVPYGKLYNERAVRSSKICPIGWHLPTSIEWNTIRDYLGGTTIAGGKLKESGLDHWLSTSAGATNETGFTAVGGGIRDQNGNFADIKSKAYFWSFHHDYGRPYYVLDSDNDELNTSTFHDSYRGLSVRCIKNN